MDPSVLSKQLVIGFAFALILLCLEVGLLGLLITLPFLVQIKEYMTEYR